MKINRTGADRRQWGIALACALSVGGASLAPASEPAPAPTGALMPLAPEELHAVAAEAKRRWRDEDPIGLEWDSLDRGKLTRLLVMPELAALDGNTKATLIDQAGAWELMPWARPSDVIARWARWYPERGFGKPIDPDAKTASSTGLALYADATWADEASAMTALVACTPGPVWVVHHQDPLLWIVEYNAYWPADSGAFGRCVRSQQEEWSGPWSGTPETARGQTSAAILEQKLGRFLLQHDCTDTGPDSCLVWLHALYSLNPRHEQLPAIVKQLEPGFKLAETQPIPPSSRGGPGGIKPREEAALQGFRRILLRKTAFLTVKLPVLRQASAQWPEGEMEKTLRLLLQQSITFKQLDSIQRGFSKLRMGDRPFVDPWATLPKDEDMDTTLAALLTRLGRDFAGPSGCAFTAYASDTWPPQFLFGYAMEKVQREQTSCGAMPYYWLSKTYDRAAQRQDAALLESIAGLRALIPGPLRQEILAGLGKDCPPSGTRNAPDPWGICAAQARERQALAERERTIAKAAEAEREANEPPPSPVEPGRCRAGIEMDVAARLGYAADSALISACKRMPADPHKSIVALAVPTAGVAHPEGDAPESFDLEVLLVASASGRILSRRRLEEAILSDAIAFTNLGIDTARYTLQPGLRAFGVTIGYLHNSRVSPYEATGLRLFVAEGGRLRQVLGELLIEQTREDVGNNCFYERSQLNRTIGIGGRRSHGFADLIVRSTLIESESKGTASDGDCAEIAHEPHVSSVALHYGGKTYRLPAALASP
ncbi:hypothetical protein [uncultured Lamprocystis sp.]|jgi:hypothetical protein|uniref:hypothetical protein n=1 Tax=uncultured Lamprocystis sp. TaxID=543132 RepID=UPI0025F4C255|nr:hypothetical protein [uncultured Lamprocystis sp.]